MDQDPVCKIELSKVDSGEFHLCADYLVEIVKQRKKYRAKIYKLVASSSPCEDQGTTLQEALVFVNLKRHTQEFTHVNYHNNIITQR